MANITSQRNGIYYLFGQPWYRIIKPGNGDSRALLKDYPDAFNYLVICAAPATLPGSIKPFVNRDGKQARLFAVFRDVLAFWEYMRSWPADRQNFFEVVPGHRAQKPHFDIDVSATKALHYLPQTLDEVAHTVLAQVVEGCLAIFAQWQLQPSLEEQLLVYSSHGDDKRSFHVVWHGYCHENNLEAEAFYSAVLAWINTHHGDRYVKLVDDAVYSTLQNFRLLGSAKANSNRTKMLHHELSFPQYTVTHRYRDKNAYQSLERQALMDLSESLLTNINDCHMLPRLVVNKPRQSERYYSEDLCENDVQECLALMRKKITEAPFTVREVTGSVIALNREAPSWCPICINQEEPHMADHPFLVVIDHAVYWKCRRNPEGRMLKLGYLLSRSHSASDVVATESSSPSTDELGMQWGLADSQDNTADVPEIITTTVSTTPDSNINNNDHVNPSSSPAIVSSTTGVPAREQIKQVLALQRQHKQQRKQKRQFSSLYELLEHRTDDNIVVPIPLPPGFSPTSDATITTPSSPHQPANNVVDDGDGAHNIENNNSGHCNTGVVRRLGRRLPRPIGAP